MNPSRAVLALDNNAMYVWVFSQNVKEHFCMFFVVDMDVGSKSSQVVGILHASHPGV